MPSLSLKIVLQDGAVTRTMKFPDGATVADATQMVAEKVLAGGAGKDYGLFLTSADDERSGCWLEDPHRLDYYLLKDGDSLHYRCRVRTLRIRMLDGSVKTMQVDESKPVETLMMNVCTKLGITNYEEYGLCREDEPMDEHPATGTLTLKRKHQHKEKDVALQQLSKKLKTDDNVEWLEQHKTLREMAVAPTETLLLKRRLFYSDRKVDARDPVQLNLLYVQARDAVLEGRHPVTEEQALHFAGIQCQVQYADYQEDKHKPGFIEKYVLSNTVSLNEFLPKNYANGRAIEKKIIKEHSKHSGLSQIEAKLLYTKTARDLPTYGVTFFLVKEMQKGKKKLVPRLLGINASSILRLDETSKEVLQVWPLTQVKTYKAGKGEMFTLNFGDYSEKEYCVKTNDAYRIRDILQGYIDLIRKKMEEAFNNPGNEGGVIHTANVESGKGTMMEVVTHTAHKGVETSFVGPSKIISAEEGSRAKAHGAQIVTAHTVIVTNQQRSEQTVLTGGVKMRGEMSVDTGKKLNDLNANAVKIVTLLNDPNQASIEEAKKIVDVIVKDMPILVEGVKHCIDQQTDEAAKKKLTFELNELTDNVAQLCGFTSPQEAQDSAMRIADLTTQMYFALDARVKRRSQLVKSSRKSFIEDERTQSTLQRASFINCVGAANHAIDDARDTLNKKYDGPELSAKEVEELERSARDRLAKLNAAIARLAAAHSDPKNIDYAAAVNAMNTIKELIPELANDAQALSSVKDGKDRNSLIREMQELLDATGKITQNIGCDDFQKMHDEANNFAKKSRRLQFIFGQGGHPDEENEVINLVKDVDDKTRLLIAMAKQLASEVNDPNAPKVKQAADNCAKSASGLTACAQLTAYSTHEPHCLSALSAAVADLVASEKLLESAYRPLFNYPEGRNRSDSVKQQSVELKKALDTLRNACSALDGIAAMDGPEAADRERKRLQFLSTLSGAQQTLSSCNKILKDKYDGPKLSAKEVEKLEHSARDRLAKLNAAIARLTAAHSDPKNIDYPATVSAMNTIKELVPELANDAQALSAVKDDTDRSSLIREMQELLDATGKISQNIGCDDLQKMHDEANNFAKKSRRLQFIFGRGGHPDKENEVTNLVKDVDDKTRLLVATAKQLASDVNDPSAPKVKQAADNCANAASGLTTCAQLTAYSTHEPHCLSALSAAVEDLALSEKLLESAYRPLFNYPEGRNRSDSLKQQSAELKKALDRLRNTCSALDGIAAMDDPEAADRERKRLQFVSTLSGAQQTLSSCDKILKDKYDGPKLSAKEVEELEHSARDGLAKLNAAIARLTAAHSDPKNIDYATAVSAINTIKELVPELVNDAQALSAVKDDTDRSSLIREMQELLDATGKISQNIGCDDMQKMHDDANNFAKKSRRLQFIFGRGGHPAKENEVINLVKDVDDKTRLLVATAKQLASDVNDPNAPIVKQAADNCANAASGLTTCAQLTAYSTHEPHCLSALSAAVEDLASSEKLLESAYRPLFDHPRGRNRSDTFKQQSAELKTALDRLRNACSAFDGIAAMNGPETADREHKRLQFVSTLSGAQQTLSSCDKILKDKYKGPELTPKDSENIEWSARGRLVQLNEAIGRLTAAHADPKNVDYATAAHALNTIKELTPALANDAQALSAVKDDKDRSSLIKAVQELLDATSSISQSIGSDNLQKMYDAANNYSKKANRLQFILGQADGKPNRAVREQQRLQFVDTMLKAQDILEQCEKNLKHESNPNHNTDRHAWAHLGELNAAIVSLLAATSDSENPNYEVAEKVMTHILQLMPDVVEGIQSESAGFSPEIRDEIRADTKSLVDAVRALGLNINHGEDTNQAVAQYTRASGKLTYILDKHAQEKTEHDIIDLTKSACGRISELLAYVYGVVAETRGGAADELDVAGTKVADAAQGLLTTVQLTATTIHTPASKDVVYQSVANLSSALDNVAKVWPAKCRTWDGEDNLDKLKKDAERELENLVVAVRLVPEPKEPSLMPELELEPPKGMRSTLDASLTRTREVIERAEWETTRPSSSKPLTSAEAKVLQGLLADKLASLNAAIAGLVTATRDQSYVNCDAVAASLDSIRQLLPEVVKDVKILSSGNDEEETRALMDHLHELCGATKTLGEHTIHVEPEKLRNAMARYNGAGSKLTFACTPLTVAKADEVQLLSKVYDLQHRSKNIRDTASKLASQDPHRGTGLVVDEKTKRAELATYTLTTTAELIAPTIKAPQCRSAIHAAAEELSRAITDLVSSSQTLEGGHLLELERKHFDTAVKDMMETLKKLEDDSQQLKAAETAAEKEKNRLKFVASVSAAQLALDNAAQELKKTGKVLPLTPPQAALLQVKLADRLATLNAAIATLVSATRDPENPDYVIAESATATIQELMPDLIKDAKSLPAGKDDAARAKLLKNLQELCDATKTLTSEKDDLQAAVDKYNNISSKLVYTFNPRANLAKEHQIIDLTKSTYEKTMELLEKVFELSLGVNRPEEIKLQAQGARVAEVAKNLLTTAEITAPSISSPLCQSSLLTCVSALSSSVDQMFSSPVITLPQHAGRRQQLQQARAKVDQEIERLKAALKDERVLDCAAVEKAKNDKLRFIASMASAEVAVQNAEKEITEPYGKPLPASAAASLEETLANRLASLNAAINSLVVATSDHNNPDYIAAESASKTIRELIPDIVKDSKSLSSSKDPKSRKELLEQIKALCEATLRLGKSANAEQFSAEELNETATQYSLASGKLNFVFNPNADQKKTHQILDTCKSTCLKTSEMLQRVHELAKQVEKDGTASIALDTKGAEVSDAARALLTTAQLTAHSAHSLPCQSALLSASDRLSATAQELQTTWTPVVKIPKYKANGEQLTKDMEAVEVDIVTLRRLVKDDGKGLPPGVKGKKPPAVPIRTGSIKGARPKGSESRTIGATREFLDRLRVESSMEKDSLPIKSPTSPSPSRTDEEKRAKLQFNKSVQDAQKSICSAEDILQTAFTSDVKLVRASLDNAQIFALNKQMEHKLARANAAAAHLLACRGGDKPDYQLASKCVGAVSDLMPTIARDAITLADLRDPVGRKLFLSDTLGLCNASKSLCDTAKSDKKKLKDVALTFGDQSSKLLYALSTDIDPSQEKEVLLRVKAAGDVACRVTEGAMEGPAAGRCAGQATVLMYTAKLVAPSIQDPECQESLITASKELSAQLKTIPVTNHPKLAQELQDLEKILEALRTDVASGKLVKRKEELVIEDTPIRKLTAQIIEDAKQNAECTTNSAEERRAMADFANKLTDTLKAMDVANARCKQAPHDLKRREELEDAVLNLQQLVLQDRPHGGAAGAAQSQIVNVTDFLNDVSTHAEQLSQCARAVDGAAPHARAAGAVAAHCAELRAAAAAPAHGAHGAPMLDVDHAAKECVSRVHKINTTIECCPEGPGKIQLQKEARPLNESCNLLQYVSQSALATAQCAALDEALNDLTDLENRIDKMLQPREGEKYAAQPLPPAELGAARAQLGVAAARAARDARPLAPAFTRYVHAARAQLDVNDQHRRKRLADHLKKLQDRLRLLIMETGRQVVTWRPANEGDVVAITDDVLRELDNVEAVIGANTEKPTNKIAYEDLKKLLLPLDTYKMEGDKKKLEAKLEPYATKLNSMSETLTHSIGKPESLARTAHVTAESAVQLTALAKALKSDEDPAKNSRIDEASQELCFITYNLLKTAESVSQEPNTFESRRRMMDACRSLSDAINKLVRASSSGDKLQRECNELNRSLQLRESTLQPRPTCALPYADCITSLQAQHDAIKNLKSEDPVSREEFSTSLDFLASAVNNNADYAEHCAYLLSISEQHPELSKTGMFDTARIQKLIATAQDTCFRVTRPGIVNQAKEESSLLSKQLTDLKQAIQECSIKVKEEGVKKQLLDASSKVDTAGMRLQAELNTANVSVEQLTPSAFTTIEALSALRRAAEQPALAPSAAPSAAAQKRTDEVINHSKELLNRASGLMRAIKTSENQQAMTWVMFNTYTKGVIEISERVIQCIRENGQQAGLIEGAIEEDDVDLTMKSYAQTQVLIANKWLQKPTYKAQIKTEGEQAARNVIDVGKKMMTHLKEAEREEMPHLIEECENLLAQCSSKYTLETGSVLMDRLKDLAKAIDRSIVTMVVEDLIEDEEPLADLDLLVDAERDETKRKFLLERKIADLLAHLGRVTKTARAVADGQSDGAELRKCSNQTELLAPMLVKAAEKRVIHPTEKAVVEEYQMKLAQYSKSLSRVRDLCDRAVDPMQFVQTAEETMQRMKEESNEHQNDLHKCSNTSTAIRKLAHRVINVSMSSQNAQRDPELMRALTAAQHKLREAEPAQALRASKLPDWRNNITEILRATGEVESVLGGEMIFQKQRESDQPIYNAALNLHAAVREWSARDNEIVAVAKRMAVLMAKLSDHMHADRKREVISTSKAIVAASHEVARLARKLALECTDMRIRTNLLQVCDQIPTISGQLKMLTTVKGSFLGNQGSDEDIEAMNMLIGNAQNLMTSIQDVVKAAASASVKIRSQRGGPKLRWVRKNYH